MTPDEKMTALDSCPHDIAAEIRKKDPGLLERLAEEAEKKEGKEKGTDRWYKQMFRSIAWGPTILLNAIIFLFFS